MGRDEVEFMIHRITEKSGLLIGHRGRGFVSWESAVGIVPRLRAGPSRLLIPAEAKEIFLFSKSSRPAVRPIQPPVHYVPAFFSGGIAAGA